MWFQFVQTPWSHPPMPQVSKTMNISSLPQVSRLGAGCGRKEGIHLGAIARFALRQGRNQNHRTWPSVHPLWNFRAAVKGKIEVCWPGDLEIVGIRVSTSVSYQVSTSCLVGWKGFPTIHNIRICITAFPIGVCSLIMYWTETYWSERIFSFKTGDVTRSFECWEAPLCLENLGLDWLVGL